MEKSDAYKVVADLLRLRKWAVEALSTGQPQSRDVAAVPRETWQLFLSLERCACPLLERIVATRALDDLPQPARDTLADTVARDAQSSITARAEGREIARIAERVGFPIVVLKGGVNAIAGRAPTLPLVDLDLLVTRGNVSTLVDELVAAGFGSPARELLHHQGITPSSDRLAVEVHWTTHDDGRPLDSAVWNRLRPISEVPPLKQLALEDHLFHLIEHAIVVHRERSIALRDVVLIGSVAQACDQATLHNVRLSLGEFDQGLAMRALLDFATSLASRRTAADPFTESCATFYSGVVLAPRFPKAFASSGALAFVLEVELGRVAKRVVVRNALRWRGTGQKQLNALANRFPVLGHGLFGPGHLVYYASVAAYTLPAIRWTRTQALNAIGL